MNSNVVGTGNLAYLLPVICCLASALLGAQSQTGAQARGMFLESRPGKAAKPAKRLAFGYSLFLDGPDGPRRVRADREFRSGEKLRLLVESNRDAYLYVFHQEGNGPATLIFPHARVAEGDNRVLAHEPLDVPAGAWFVFDENPGEERLTLILSESPLPNVPRGPDLPRQNELQITKSALEKLIAGAQPVLTDATTETGAPMRPSEGTRGIKLSTADPAPSNVVMKKSSQAGHVVARLVLQHR